MYDAIRRGTETDASAARIGLTSYFALIDVADKHLKTQRINKVLSPSDRRLAVVALRWGLPSSGRRPISI